MNAGADPASSDSARRTGETAGDDRDAAILTMLQLFLTTHPDRPCGWPILVVSADGGRCWRYG